ncbi:NYN domain-containing protein [Agrobacterium deltaense]|uniref:NYN domain-containing protein n=1 Tax=Agrobacterium deltaense TaxID=1183412 RepID=UPI003D994595
MTRQMKTLFLVDGSHYDRLRSVLETPFDLRKLAWLANDGASVDQAIYYRDLRDDNEAERQRSLLGWLGHNGFVVKGRTHGPGEPRERYGTNLVQIAVDVLLTAEPGDHVMVLAGDAKLEPLFAALRKNDIKVTLISTLDAPNTIAPASALIEATDNFIDLRTVVGQLSLEKADTSRSD